MQKYSGKRVHFIGIGGVGMSGLALILHQSGAKVTGSDLVCGKMCEALEAHGLALNYGSHTAENLPQDLDYVVYSSAVHPENPEYIEALRRQVPCIRRGEFLGQLAQNYEFVIGVSGSHGKTTTTALLVDICRQMGLEPGFLIGGQVCTWADHAAAGNGSLFISEIDESDATQQFFKANLALILNIEDDHSWSAGGHSGLFSSFQAVARKADQVLAYEETLSPDVLSAFDHIQWLNPTDVPELKLPQPGFHNRKNAWITLLAAQQLGLSVDECQRILERFPGVARRMTRHLTSDQVVVVEDYAHHPTEVAACIDGLREAWPNHHLHVIFEPHRFERIRHYSAGFSAALSMADEITVTSPFAAWNNDSAIADPESIVQGIKNRSSRYVTIENLNFLPLAESLAVTTLSHEKPTLLAILGAGSITGLVTPLLSALSNARN